MSGPKNRRGAPKAPAPSGSQKAARSGGDKAARSGGRMAAPSGRHEAAPSSSHKAAPSGNRKEAPKRPMPGGAEAVRAQRQARAAASPEARPVDDGQGGAIIRSAWLGTTVFVVATAVAALVPSARIPVVAVDLLLFVGGSVVYFWGFVTAVGRSRHDEISLWNLNLLEDIAPGRVRARLLGALGGEIVVVAATCWITPALAFGLLVPVWGLAHGQLWGARYGVFPARSPAPAGAKAGFGRRNRR